MKEKMSLWTKIKFMYYWFRKYNATATIVKCGNCNSGRITFSEGRQEGNVYKSKYRCEDCGATATCTEIWQFNNSNQE